MKSHNHCKNGKIQIIVKKIEAWKAGKKDKMGPFLDFIKGFGQRKESSSFTVHKSQKALEKNKVENNPKNNKEMEIKWLNIILI